MDGEEFDIGEDTAWIAIAVVAVATLGGAVLLAEWPLWGVQPDVDDEPHLVEPADGGTELWPYTSRAMDYNTRTLGINVVFHGDSEDVRTALEDRSALRWEEEQVHEGDADSDTISPDRIEVDPEADDIADIISWEPAEGSVRYSYFEVDGDGQWVDESYELHSGTYLGERLHIRAYDEPQQEWTAVQIHEEHWDWFRLRHTVTGISDSQRELERDFMGQPDVDEVVRLPFENETADSDGWVTNIYFAGAVLPFLLFGVVSRATAARRQTAQFLREHRRAIALGVTLFALYTAVRWLGIAGELLFDGVSPKVVAAPLYLALAVGIPAVAYRFGRGSDTTWAFSFAVLGLGAALIVDFVAMGVSVLPLRYILHRAAVLLAVGLIAVGGALAVDDRRPTPLSAGLACWALALLLPVFGYI